MATIMRRSVFREQMLALQREVFHRNQERINQGVFGYTAAYRRYEKEYQERVTGYQAESTFEELLGVLVKAQVVYLGDYHTLAQAQKSVVRLLRRLPKNMQPTLAMEFVQGEHQAPLDAFMAGRINDQTFLKRIHHDPNGVFGAWEHFKPIFDIARERRLPVVGIDLVQGHTSKSLKERDTYAAKQIVDAMQARPEHPVIVHMGELHVAPQHLPIFVEKELKKRRMKPARKLIIYQNCEEIYWKLESAGKEDTVEVLKVQPSEYCIITTPPIVCQQSYLNWLDADDEMFEDQAPEKVFKQFVEIIARVLGIPVGHALDDVQVSSVIDVHFLEIVKRRGGFSSRDMAEIKRQILRSESYFVPKANMVYLGKLSINHAAEEASHFLRHVCGGDVEPRALVEAFYFRVLNETIGFLGSKLINHKRKCPHVRDFASMLKRKEGDSFTRRIARYIVKHRKLEQGERPSGLREMYTSDADMFNAVTHALGYILGDKLYYGMVQGIVSKADVRGLYFDHFEEDGMSLTTYLTLVTRLEKVKLPKRSM